MGWGDVDATLTGVGPDPLYTIPDQLVQGNVLVVGGAAGQGGLEAGLEAGRMAGEAVVKALKGKGKFSEYERQWKRRYLRTYVRLADSNDGSARLTDEELQRVLHAWDRRHVGAQPTLPQLLANPKGLVALFKAVRLARSRAPAA